MGHSTFKKVLERLRSQMGEVARLDEVAELLRTTSASLRRAMSLNRDDVRLRLLRKKRRKIGKRIFFPVDVVAAIVALSDEEIVEAYRNDLR